MSFTEREWEDLCRRDFYDYPVTNFLTWEVTYQCLWEFYYVVLRIYIQRLPVQFRYNLRKDYFIERVHTIVTIASFQSSREQVADFKTPRKPLLDLFPSERARSRLFASLSDINQLLYLYWGQQQDNLPEVVQYRAFLQKDKRIYENMMLEYVRQRHRRVNFYSFVYRNRQTGRLTHITPEEFADLPNPLDYVQVTERDNPYEDGDASYRSFQDLLASYDLTDILVDIGELSSFAVMISSVRSVESRIRDLIK